VRVLLLLIGSVFCQEACVFLYFLSEIEENGCILWGYLGAKVKIIINLKK
jgi:hypothetical protein